jgi:hypothetical protein
LRFALQNNRIAYYDVDVQCFGSGSGLDPKSENKKQVISLFEVLDVSFRGWKLLQKLESPS